MRKKFIRLVLAALMALPAGVGAQETLLDEGFGAASPTGWQGATTSIATVFGGSAPYLNGSIAWSYASSARGGLSAGHYYCNIYNTGQYKWMVTPSVDLGAVSGATLTFDLALTDYNKSSAPSKIGTDKKFVVAISTDGGTTWSADNATQWLSSDGDYTFSDIPNTYHTYSIDLAAYVGSNVRIAFYAESNASSSVGGDIDIHLDNVKVSASVSCYPPTGLALSEVGSTSFTAVWQPSGHDEGSWQYVLAQGSSEPNWLMAQSTTEPEGGYSDLDPYTRYTLYVRSVCADDDQSRPVSLAFNTAADCGERSFHTAAIGDGSTSVNYMPFYGSTVYKYAASWQLFKADELAEQEVYAGAIRSLAWHYTSTTDAQVAFKIYMCNTSVQGFGSKADTIARDAMTLVYDGTYGFHAGQWDDIILDTPFEYDGTSNLAVMVVRTEDVNTDMKFEHHTNASGCGVSLYGSNASMNSNIYSNYYRLNTRFALCQTETTCLPADWVQRVGQTATSVSLRWGDSRNAEGTAYEVVYASAASGLQRYLSAPGDTAATISGLTPATDYAFLLRPVCGMGDTALRFVSASATTLRAGTDITAFSCTAIQRAEAIIDVEAHTVVLPIRYTGAVASQTFRFELSDRAGLYLADTEGNYTIRRYISSGNLPLVIGEPFTVRIIAEDTAYHTDWTITLQPEACTAPEALTLAPERTRMGISWQNPDPSVSAYDLYISPTPMTDDELASASLIAVQDTMYYYATDLERGTTYHVYLRSNCGENLGEWLSATTTTRNVLDCPEGYEVAVNGTADNGSFPVYGYGASNKQLTQSIYPASMLQAYVGHTIKGLKYFTKNGGSFEEGDDWDDEPDQSWENANFTIRLAVTEQESLTGGWDHTEGTDVYTGHLAVAHVQYGGSTMEIVLDQEFYYPGGNLLVEFDQSSSADRVTCSFYGVSATGASRWMSSTYAYNNQYKQDNVGTVANFLPKLALMTCVQSELCPTASDLHATDIEHNEATLRWSASDADYLSEYQLVVSADEVTDFDAMLASDNYFSVGDTAYTVDNLQPATLYHAYLRAVCNADERGEGESSWIEATFTTAPTCRVPQGLTLQATGKHTALAQWQRGTTANPQADNFSLVLSTTRLADPQSAEATLAGIDTTLATLADLQSGTRYYVYVWNRCSESDASAWIEDSLLMPPAMPTVVNLRAETVEHNAFTARWERDEALFADERMWSVAVAEGDAEPTEWVSVEGTPEHLFYGLTSSTAYTLHCVAIDGDQHSDTARASLTTEAMPTEGFTIADGTDNNAYVPVKGNSARYAQHTQTIYPASMFVGRENSTITSLKYFVSSGGSSNQGTYARYSWEEATFTIRMAITQQTSVYSNFIDLTDADIVYTGHLRANIDSGMYILLDRPFLYTTGNLLVDFQTSGNSSNVNGNYACQFVAQYDSYGVSRCRYQDNSYSSSASERTYPYLPKVKFGMPSTTTCLPVAHLAASGLKHNAATLGWYPGHEETQWQVVCDTALTAHPDTLALAVVSEPRATLTGLQGSTLYHAYVRPYCSESEQGQWQNVDFTTERAYSVQALADALRGTATGGGLFGLGDSATLKATALYGYHFASWSNGLLADSITIRVESDTTLTALFEPNLCAVHGLSNDEAMGQVLVQYAQVPYLGLDTLVAVPATGYTFEGWSNGVATDTLVLVVESDTTVAARFAVGEFEVSARAGNATMGHVEGTLRSTYGAIDTLVAVAHTGYHFTGWSNGVLADTLFLTVEGDTSVVAYFAINRYAVRALSSDTLMGSVQVSDTLADHGIEVTFTALPLEGFGFSGWSNGTADLQTVVTVVSDTTLTAQFYRLPVYYTVSVSYDSTMGSVSGVGTYVEDTPVTLAAIALDGFHFVVWSTGDSSATITLVPTSDTLLTATFEADPEPVVDTLRVAVGVSSVEGVPFYGWFADKFQHSQFIYPADMLTPLVGATLKGVTFYAEESDELHDFTFTSYFTVKVGEVQDDEISWTDRVFTNEASLATVHTGSLTLQGSEITILFDQPVTYQGGNLKFDITATPGTTLRVAFRSLRVSQYASVVNYDNNYIPSNYYTTAPTHQLPTIGFIGSGIDMPDTPPVPDTVRYTVSVSYDATRGTVSGAGQYVEGATATLVSTPFEGFRFAGWADGTTDSVLTFVVTSDTTFTALFEPAQVGIETAEAMGIALRLDGRTLGVQGCDGRLLQLFDMQGRQLAASRSDCTLTLPAAGIYLLRLDGAPLRRLVVR